MYLYLTEDCNLIKTSKSRDKPAGIRVFTHRMCSGIIPGSCVVFQPILQSLVYFVRAMTEDIEGFIPAILPQVRLTQSTTCYYSL